VPGIDRPRQPERAVLCRVLFHHFNRFLAEYECRFEKELGYFRSIVREVVERYLDCANPRSGFARLRCPDCHGERLLMFSRKTRGFCPSGQAKRLEEWGEWVRPGQTRAHPDLGQPQEPLSLLQPQDRQGYRKPSAHG